MKRAILLLYFLIIVCFSYGQQLYNGVYTEVTLISDSEYGTDNFCYDKVIDFSYNCIAPTGMNLYVRIDSINGICDSVQVYRHPDYNYQTIHVHDTINISSNIGNQIFFYFQCNSTLFISIVAIGTPQILGENYHCNYSKQNQIMADDNCVYYSTGFEPLDTCSVLDYSTGIINKQIDKIEIYPNPTTNNLYIECNSQNTTFSITDMLGKEIKQIKAEVGKTSIDVSEFKNGIYFINWVEESSSRAINKKFVVAK